MLGAAGVDGRVVAGTSTFGAGSAPGREIPTAVIELGEADRRFERLLGHTPPVLARRSAGRLLVDLRTVDPDDDDSVAAALAGS